jgi:phosphate transport system substrate-binding protein
MRALSYDGATTIGVHLLPDLLPLFQRRGGSFGSLRDRGTDQGLGGVRAGEVDVAGVMRAITPAEQAAADLRWVLVGHDALGLFVHASNPLAGVSRAQLKGIFTGALRGWGELGWRDSAVVPITERKAGGRGTVQELRRIALDGDPYGATLEHEDAPSCLRAVMADPDGVTVASMSMALPGVRAVAIDGVSPSAANVRSGAYLLGRPMYLVSRAPPSEAAAALLELVVSDEGQAVVARKFTPAR